MNNFYIIDDRESKNAPLGTVEQTQHILSILKAKGAPVLGTMVLRADNNYIFTSEYDFIHGQTKYSWKKRRED